MMAQEFLEDCRRITREGAPELRAEAERLSKAKIFLVQECDALAEARLALREKPDALNELWRAPYRDMLIEIMPGKDQENCNVDRILYCIRVGESGAWEIGVVFQTKTRELRPYPLKTSFMPGTYFHEPDTGFFGADIIRGFPRNEDEDYVAQRYIDVVALIGLINSKKIITVTDSPDVSRLNRKRAKNNRPPLIEYKVIRISDAVRTAFRDSKVGDGSTKLHWRRGHFKARKTGVFWWSAHTAGRKENGEVISGYLMEEA